jgi:uncharacterized membrane protein (DUF106 family)
MTALNAALTRAADLVLAPLAGLSAVAVVVGFSLGSALVVLGVMRVASNQTALAAVKRRIHAALLEMRLFNDDLRALLRAQGEVLRHNVAYVGYSLVPLVITAIPLTLVIAQLQAWYGYTGVAPDAPFLVTATLARDLGREPVPRLEGPGVELVGEPRYFPTLKQVVWRVVPRQPGALALTVAPSSGAPVSKTLQVAAGDTTARRSPVRDRGGLSSQLLYPSEPPIDATSAIAAVEVPYAERSLRLAGAEVHWLILYVVATFAFVLLLRKPLGVVI